jgi:hypothetical protein
MNCRTFQRNLEDYLEDGLDFAGRFGMERHAQQCISCGKTLADAQRLGRLAREMQRVKAPLDFEAAVLEKIGKRKLDRRFSRLRRLWIYGFDFPSWRKLALASCSLAVLLLGLFFWPRYSVNQAPTVSVPPLSVPPGFSETAAKIQATKHEPVKPVPVRRAAAESAAKNRPLSLASISSLVEVSQNELIADPEERDPEFVEYLVPGPDNRPVTIRLPKRIQMQYGQASEEYFIRNVSH